MNYKKTFRVSFLDTLIGFKSYELITAEDEHKARDLFWNLYGHKKSRTVIVGISNCYVDPETGDILG